MKRIFTLLVLAFITSVALAQDPVAKINIPSSIWCEGEDVIMNNQSLNANAYVWYFGDGDTSHRKRLDYRYKVKGVTDSFIVSLVAKDTITGKSDSVTKKIFVQKRATASFTFRAIAVVAFFYNDSKDYLGLEWDFDDGSNIDLSDGDSLTHVFPGSGTYNVELTATTDFGCDDDTVREVVIVDSAGGNIGEANLYKMSLFPNPGNQQVLEFELNQPEALSIYISDASGRLIESLNKTYAEGRHRINVGEILNGEAPGIYFVSLNDKRTTYLIKAHKTE